MDPFLYKAAMLGHTVDQSIDLLHQKTPKDNNVLHIAAEYKQIKFFEKIRLDSQSPLFWATNKKGETPLHIAARVGCPEVVKFLINHAKTLHIKGADQESGPADGEAHKNPLRMTNFDKDTALHAAARYGHDGVANLLIEADPQLCCFTNSANESPLFLAVSHGFQLIAGSILNCPVSPSFQGINGVTALHAAVTHRDKEAKGNVALMVSKNPDIIKEVDALGWTPLHYAAFRGNLEAVRVLMQCDSSACYILDKSGMSALHVAAYAGHPKITDDLIRCRPDTCDLLNAKGQTFLHSAVLGGQTDVIKYVLKTSKLERLINEADEDGNTPLHLAVIHKKWERREILGRDDRVHKSAINKELSKAVDIAADNFAADNIGKQGVKALHQLGRSVGVPFFRQQISREFKKMESSPEKDTSNTQPNITVNGQKLPENCTDQVMNGTDTDLIVAVLIATVTFAAALTLPGGYKSDGAAVLQENIFFQTFMVFNCFSFFSSTLVILAIFWERFLSINRKEDVTGALLHMSIGGMMAAYASGTLAFLYKGSALLLAVGLFAPIIAMFVGSTFISQLKPLSTFPQ
ncbi:ankyrin repeat-containing protein [Pyrus ussuriensis x Pyrus communis]|uniref:Ankyrin repeat-containing protein n=1 Tax=Pyrus ussuriensis x Pyrus communis TaxID=2448454 RepID=A0A5N5FL92_9ROSA|nr:ankyrin repeat-containing protein [Pyrus ussuriensis x Pyrus communis]